MINRTLGAPLGGAMRGDQYGLDWRASRSIRPPNFCGAAGICSPGIVVVALGEPGTPVICWAKPEVPESTTAAVKAVIAKMRGVAVIMGNSSPAGDSARARRRFRCALPGAALFLMPRPVVTIGPWSRQDPLGETIRRVATWLVRRRPGRVDALHDGFRARLPDERP